MEDLTREKFQMAYPDLFKEIVSESVAQGIKDGLDQGKSQGLTEGIEAERNRIKDVEAQLIPGHEALIETLKWDGKTTGPEAAIKVLAAEKNIRIKAHKDFVEDGQNVNAPVVNPPADQKPGMIDDNLPIEEKAEAEWKKPAIRLEFGNNKAAYVAFRKAEDAGLAKIFKGGKE